MNNLSTLAVESDECRNLLYQVSLKPFLDGVRYHPMGISFHTKQWKGQGRFFWKFVLREALHSGGLGMWSDKSIDTFLDRLQARQLKAAWLQCRKDYAVHLGQEGEVHVFYPLCFPFRKVEAYGVDGSVVEYSELDEKSASVGPWSISASWAVMENVKSLQKEILVGTRAVSSFDSLMEGLVEYYVRVPTWVTSSGDFEPRPLIFRKFDKVTRPPAWKGCDLKLQDILPILGNDETANFGLKDPRGAGCTHLNERKTLVTNPTKVAKVTLRLTQSARPSNCRNLADQK